MMQTPQGPDTPLVIHVIPSPVARGAQREARALADALDRPGTRSHRLLALFDGPSGVPTDLTLAHPAHAAGVGFDPRLVRRLRAELQVLDPAVVVAHGSEPLKYLVPAMLFRPRPLVYYAIGTYSGTGAAPQRALWRFLLGRPDLVVAEGEEVRLECIERFGVPEGKIVFIPNGRDPALFRPSDEVRGPEPQIVFVGALTAGKRPDLFISAVRELRHRGAGFRARIIGDGPLRPELEQSAQSADVELMGSQNDVPELLRRADVLVFTSLPSGEGMPGVLIEAGLTGLPVVATDVPGVRTIVQSGITGFVVDDRPDSVTDALAELLGRPELRESMGRAARHHCVDRFDLGTVAAQWSAALAPLLVRP